MSRLFGRNWSKQDLMERVGDASQLGGIRNVTLNDGNENGVRAVEVCTGSGLRFTVLPDRGMDILDAEFSGRSLCWRSSTGAVAPSFFESIGPGWLRGFFGGLLTTCGLSYVGPADVDEGEVLGVHGRVSYIPARDVCTDCRWDGDEYLMSVRGRVTETSSLGPRVTLTRNICSELGANSLSIDDTIENEGYLTSPFTMLYHINLGFPVVSKDAILLSPTKNVTNIAGEAITQIDQYRRFDDPQAETQEGVFCHEMVPDEQGYVTAALIARKPNPFGVFVRYRMKELPLLWEWRMLRRGVYVVALEPANCRPEERSKSRKRGDLKFLRPGEVVRHHVEIGVCTSEEEIATLERHISGATTGP